jgi:hypothetical protein
MQTRPRLGCHRSAGPDASQIAERTTVRMTSQLGFSLFALILSVSLPMCTLAATSGSVAGVIRDEAGTPVAGVSIALGDRATTTDRNGSFVFTDVVPKKYVLSVGPTPDSGLAGDFFTLGNLAGATRIDVQGAAVTRVSRTLSRAGQIQTDLSPPQESAADRPSLSRGDGAVFLVDPKHTNGGGFLFWGLEPRGDYVLEYEPMGYRRQVVRGVSVAVGQVVHVALVNDPNDATGITGTLTTVDGRPLADALVFAVLDSDPETRGTTKTNATGHFTVVGLPAGTYTVEAVGSGPTPAAKTTVTAGRRTPVALVWPQ